MTQARGALSPIGNSNYVWLEFSTGCGCGYIRGVKRLSRYIGVLADRCASLPDKRSGRNTRYRMRDVGLAPFSVFFMQCPSFLAHRRLLAASRGRSNAETLFGMSGVPCDNHIRGMLDGAPPGHFDKVFSHIVNDPGTAGGLSALRCLDDRVLIALDGSERFHSRKVHCAQCATRRRDGAVEYFHSFVGAAIVAPGQRRAAPLAPEFVRPQDGAVKQDCESRAALRRLARLGPALARLKPVYLGDDLYSRQPTCEAARPAPGSRARTAMRLQRRTHPVATATHIVLRHEFLVETLRRDIPGARIEQRQNARRLIDRRPARRHASQPMIVETLCALLLETIPPAPERPPAHTQSLRGLQPAQRPRRVRPNTSSNLTGMDLAPASSTAFPLPPRNKMLHTGQIVR